MLTTLSQIIVKNIKELRTEQGIKCETLAKAIGKTKGAISHLESGQTDLKISQLTEIAKALNTDVCTLVCEQHSRTGKKFSERSSLERRIVIEANVM
jgi:transcriptional regulator with XRE-family HTH domain